MAHFTFATCSLTVSWENCQWVDGLPVFSNLKVQMITRGATRATHLAYKLALVHPLTLFDMHFKEVGVETSPLAVVTFNNYELSVAAESSASIDHDAIVGRIHGGALWCSNVDASMTSSLAFFIAKALCDLAVFEWPDPRELSPRVRLSGRLLGNLSLFFFKRALGKTCLEGCRGAGSDGA